MTLGEFRRLTNSLPDNYELVDFYTDLFIDDVDIDNDNELIYFITEDD